MFGEDIYLMHKIWENRGIALFQQIYLNLQIYTKFT